jgi:hypothetical protein
VDIDGKRRRFFIGPAGLTKKTDFHRIGINKRQHHREIDFATALRGQRLNLRGLDIVERFFQTGFFR